MCGASLTNYQTNPQRRDDFTQNTVVTEPAASPTVPVMALETCSLVPMGEGGTRPHHMVFYVVGLQHSTGEQSCQRKDPVH